MVVVVVVVSAGVLEVMRTSSMHEGISIYIKM